MAKPIHYNLFIEPDTNLETFNGTTNIVISIEKNNTNHIIMHSKNLKYKYIRLNAEKVTYELNDEKELLTINCNNLNSGTHMLTFEYNGIINSSLEGLYKSTSMNGSAMIVTQFQVAHARKVFPCFDEPKFKATFDIILKSSSDKVFLSNTAVKEIIPELRKDGEYKTVIFETTPLMSTYIVAFCISDELDYVEKKCEDSDILVRCYATKGKGSKLLFSLDVAIKALKWYIEWFGIKYPLTKLDMLAVPDFSAGAMENWGLITYRETVLLVDDSTEDIDKQDVAITICHELAHQWFGNLVTMEWWTYLWLNESMATYFSWLVSDNLFPEWKMWEKFDRIEYISALELDSLETSHPVEMDVYNIEDIEEIFDAISYSKGACLIRFLVSYIGMDLFRKGMKKYLKDNMYGTTTSEDLWRAFDSNQNQNQNQKKNKNMVKDIMVQWTRQVGYPLVTVTYFGDTISINQERFYKSGPSSEMVTWIIPIEIFDGDKKVMTIILDKPYGTFEYKYKQRGTINNNRNGFYRVRYGCDCDSKSNGTIDDAFSLSLSGYQGFKRTFDLVGGIDFYNNYDYKMWGSLVSYLELMYAMITKMEMRQKYEENVLEPIYGHLESILMKLGWDNNGNQDLCDLAIATLGYHCYEPIVKEALNRFDKGKEGWENKKSVIIPIIAEFRYDKLVEIYNKTDDASIVVAILDGFANVKSKKLLKKSLEMVFEIREQHQLHYIKRLSQNKYCTNKIWDLVTSNWDRFNEKAELSKAVAAGFKTQEQLNKYIDFFTEFRLMNMAVKQTIEKINNRILMIKRIDNDLFIRQILQGIN